MVQRESLHPAERLGVVSVLFWLRSSRRIKHAGGASPVNLRVTYANGRRVDVHSGFYCQPEHWIKSKGRVSPINPRMEEINAEMDRIEAWLRENLGIDRNRTTVRRKILLILGRTTGVLPDKYLRLGSKEKHFIRAADYIAQYGIPETVMPVFNLFLQAKRDMVTPRLFKQYCRYVLKFQEYSKSAFGTEDPSIDVLTIKTMKKYYEVLRYKQNYRYGTIVKFVGFLRMVVEFGLEEEILTESSVLQFRAPLFGEKQKLEFLLPAEVAAIRRLEIDVFALDLARDLFLFQCYTGLAYLDMKTLEARHIRTDENGITWIDKKREKTSVRSLIPLNTVCLEILKKYRAEIRDSLPVERQLAMALRVRPTCLLIVPSNQKYNQQIRKLGPLIGAETVITSHIARKTFACNALNSTGMSVETVAAMLGHMKIKTTLTYYAKVDERRIRAEMNNFEFLRM